MIDIEDDGCVSTNNSLVAELGQAGEAKRLCLRADINPMASFRDSEHAALLADAPLMTDYHMAKGNHFRLWRALSHQIHPTTKFRGKFRNVVPGHGQVCGLVKPFLLLQASLTTRARAGRRGRPPARHPALILQQFREGSLLLPVFFCLTAFISPLGLVPLA